MSKGVRRVLSIAAAIAIPFAAPIIAGSAALAAVTGAIGTTATSALVGAGLGAAKGAVLGEDVGRSALMGGVAGGISGYLQPVAGAPAGGAPGATGITPGAEVGLSPPPVDYSLSSAVTPSSQYGLSTVPAADYGLTSGMAPTAGLQINPATAAQAGGAAPATFTQALAKVPQTIAARFQDPAVLADLTLRAAGAMAGSAVSDEGLTPEEVELLNAQRTELETLRSQNAELFNQRLTQAQALIGESKYFDPEYFGLQRARQAQIRGATAKRAGLRGVTGERRAAAGRRYDLATARDTGTAFDVGFDTGVKGRLGTMQAGLTAMPTTYPDATSGYSALRQGYTSGQTAADARERRQQDDIGELFGSVTGGAQSQRRG